MKQRLIEFCQENTLVIANTLFQQHKRRLYTWTSPDGQHWNQIDYILFFFFNVVLVLPYISMNPPQVYTCSQSWTPLPPLFPYHPSGSSQCTSPKHPVSCIEPRLVIRFLYDIIHVSVPFSQIIPPSPSPTESKSLFYTCVSFAVSHTGLSLPSF